MKRMIALFLILGAAGAVAAPAFADPNFAALMQTVVMFRAEIPHRDGVRTVASSAVILKKITQADQTVVYVAVPPGPLFGESPLNIQQAAKYVSIGGFEFAAEPTGGLCWSAETVILKAIIPRESKTYLPNVYDRLAGSISQTTAWQTGNRYPTAAAKYWVIGYDFAGDVWELVKIKPVAEQVAFAGTNVSAITPNTPLNRPPVIYRFTGANLQAAATAGNLVVDAQGTVVAIVLDIAESKAHLTAIPSQPVFECAAAFFNGAKITFP